MKQRRDVLGRLLQESAAPLPGLPIAELAGDRRLLIENHQGVTEYSPQRIRVCVRFGELCINGCGLSLAKMSKEQLVIFGSIDNISILRRGK